MFFTDMCLALGQGRSALLLTSVWRKTKKWAHNLHQLSHTDKESTRQQYPVLHTLIQDTVTRHIDRQHHTTELYKDSSLKKIIIIMHPYLIPNLFEFLLCVEHKRRCFIECSSCCFPYNESEYGLTCLYSESSKALCKENTEK